MFAAMCGTESDFFQDHLQRFVAIAPFVKLENISSPLLKDIYQNNTVIEIVKNMGPELFTTGQMENPAVRAMLSGAVGMFGQGKMLEAVSDSDTSFISKKAKENFFKFFPAGSSFNCLDHFRQMMTHGRFCRMTNDEDYDLTKIRAETKISLICGKGD